MPSLLCERDINRAFDKLIALERFALRRERFVDALDFDALDLQTQREIEMADYAMAEDICSGHAYIDHLCRLEAACGLPTATAQI